MRTNIRGIFAAMMAAAAILLSPITAGTAAAQPNCESLPARIAVHNAEVELHEAQVTALNARGGGTPAEAEYYNQWKDRLNVERDALNAEEQECNPSWGSAGHADQLPRSGDFQYIPPRSGRGQPVPAPGGRGFVDKNGNVWQWARPGAQHGGPHWDVQLKAGGYQNVYPDGSTR
jgi:hypothetical protein